MIIKGVNVFPTALQDIVLGFPARHHRLGPDH